MTFVLSGFTHQVGFRVFEFNAVENGKARGRYTVRAEMMLVQKHGIHVQELPLLCRKVLDECKDHDRVGLMTLSEAEMMLCAERGAARQEAMKKRRPRKRASSVI